MENNKNNFPYPEMTYTYETYVTFMRQVATFQILNKSQSDNDQYVYWDEFLGDYAGIERGEDRNFATAVAINALIDTWTYTDANNTRQWIEGVPQNVT